MMANFARYMYLQVTTRQLSFPGWLYFSLWATHTTATKRAGRGRPSIHACYLLLLLLSKRRKAAQTSSRRTHTEKKEI